MTYYDSVVSYFKRQVPDERRRAIRRYLRLNFRGLQNVGCRLAFGSNLRSLARYYGTDKWGEHRYAEHYETFFGPLRRKKIVLLEIGIGGEGADPNPELGGASLRMWRSYFPRGKIVGIDINDKKPHEEARIKTFKGSQDDEVFLENVIREIGRPDIIVDDGSHHCRHVLESYRVLFPKLKPGGYYVIEDLFFAYLPNCCEPDDTDPDSSKNSVGYFKQLIHSLNQRERVDMRDTNEYGDPIVAICFYNNLLIIKKGADVPAH